MSDRPASPRWIATACLLVGIAAAAHPLYLFPHFGAVAYSVTATPVEDDVGDPVAVDVEELPPRAREAVATELAGGEATLYTDDHRTAIDALIGPGIVDVGGDRYNVDLRASDPTPEYAGPVRAGLSLLGGFSIAIGLLVGYAGELRPATSARAAAIPPVVLGTAFVSLRPGVLAAADLAVPEVFAVVIALALYVPLASEAARSRDRDSGRIEVALGIAAAFVVGGVTALMLELPTALYPVGGLAATVSYLLAPAEG